MATIGYARVSTEEQHLDLQLDALKAASCSKIFTDKISGTKDERPGLNAALDYLREGDVLVVWKLDRLGRTLLHLIELVKGLEKRGIGLSSVRDNIDTTTPAGMLFFHLMGALAEFERELIRERTMAGLAAAKAQGKTGGRPSLLDAKQIVSLRLLKDGGQFTDQQIRDMMGGISPATFHRYLKLSRQEEQQAG